ncbi:hypothetical protein [Dyella nitratireducens]|uniref:Uncharacterized protein n=1 Tax=Dyella nitratireducens TaxID=1849580 RepID=A0ABQ1GN41_9GAMM|nr:hypothetical protein [Dyella nitratireducens]GGA47167.1 hypothetical protein GCM10010981_40450 [Dyella nitratireducens]GLQ41547.1 hypothetical protein GCM10007902_13970 [Dyella nitratireducens]
MGKKTQSASVALDATSGSDQLTVVICAVGDQLHADGHALDPSKTMDKDYGYSSDLMLGFLGGVHGRLAWHQPPYSFSFDTDFSDSAVQLTVGSLITKINNQTQLRSGS